MVSNDSAMAKRQLKERAKGILCTLWPIVVLTLLCLAFYWDALWVREYEGLSVLGRDATDMHAHWLRFAAASLKTGRFPLWNPYLFSGQPLVANPQAALFYPPTWLIMVLPVVKALNLIAVQHLWLAGVGMYGWLRSEGASPAGALFGATVLTFSGFSSVRMHEGHIGVITTSSWLPFVLWAFSVAAKRSSWSIALLGGVPVGLSILAGHTASFVYVALGLLAYAIWYAWDSRRRAGTDEAPTRNLLLHPGLAALMLLAGIALAAIQLLPMVEFSALSTRQLSPRYEFAARFSWPPGYLLTLLVPNFFGEPAHTGYWGDGVYHEYIYYVGILPLFLAALGLRCRHRLTPFLFALGLGSLLLAFGRYGALHPFLYRFIPVFKMMRVPARAGFLFTLSAAAQAGLSLTALESAHQRALLPGSLSRSLVAGVTAGAVLLIVASFAAFAMGRETLPAAGRLWHQANQVTLFLLFFLLSAGLLKAWPRLPLRQSVWLATGLAVLDLWTFGSGMVEVSSIPVQGAWHVAAQAVATNENERLPLTRVLPWGFSDIDQSGGMEVGLYSVFGYDPLVLQRYQEFIDSRPDLQARTYDLLNAGYLITLAPQEFPALPDAPRLVLERDGTWVYRRPNALPRAWIATRVEVLDDVATLARIHAPDFDPRTTALVDTPVMCPGAGPPEENRVELVHYEGNRIEALVQGGGGMLIFSEIYYPGWYAAVDGERVPLVRADYLLRALCVPAGTHHIVLTYDPPLLKAGLIVTAVTLSTITVASALLSRRESTRA